MEVGHNHPECKVLELYDMPDPRAFLQQHLTEGTPGAVGTGVQNRNLPNIPPPPFAYQGPLINNRFPDMGQNFQMEGPDDFEDDDDSVHSV